MIVKLKDKSITDIKLKIGIYGDSGTGKTVLASTFPNVCFVDMNDGLLSVRNSNASAIKIERPKEPGPQWMQSIESAVNEIEKSDEIESICIDSMSEVGTAMMQFVQFKNSTLGKNPNFEDWRIFFNMLENFIVNVKSMDKHCIFIAHSKIDKDELVGKVWSYPAIQGQMKTAFSSYFDEFYHSEVEQDFKEGYKYRLLARPSSIYVAKSRLLKDPKITHIDNPSYATLIKLLLNS